MAITAGLSGAGRLAAFRVGKNPLANCAKNQYNRIVSLNISMNEVLLMPLWKRTLAALLLAVMMILPFASAEDAGEAVPDDSVEWTEGAANITRDLTLNDEGDDVSALQTALTDLCYYSGDVTGRYGEATKTAVEDFQRDFALAVTGMADKATQEAIYAADYRPLRLGCVGEDVRQAQIRLMALGYYTGKISGRYLPATQEAIRLFQTANALPITGEADVQTLERLFSGDAISRDSSAAATPTPSPTPGMHLSDETTTPTPAPTVAFVKKLQYNKAKGEEVKLVQTRLTELGYYSGNISGNFLGHTRNAVKAFQQQNALSVDGIVGENTWNALFNDPERLSKHMEHVEQYERVLPQAEENGFSYREFSSIEGTRRKPMPGGKSMLLKLDWLMARGMECVDHGTISTETKDCTWAEPGSALAKFTGPELSDHNACWADCRFAK